MPRIPGPKPVLTAAGIRRIFAWHARRQAFRARYGTIRALAARQGLPVHLVVRALQDFGSLMDEDLQFLPDTAPIRDPLTLRQRRALARWLTAFLDFSRGQPSAAQLAAQLHVSRWVVFDCLKRAGRYAGQDGTEEAPVGRSRSRPASLSAQGRARLLTRWPVTQSTTEFASDQLIESRKRKKHPRGGS